MLGTEYPESIGGTSSHDCSSCVVADSEDLGKKPMAAKSALLSPYEQRVKLVQETLTTNSSIDDVAAGELAVHVLHALNSIPERIR
jgi:hypothetical protein